ncbi:hypothetical protein WAT24_06240 [Fulvimonas yonginensis]|uniref:Uncharacterized protein n=1 Tax=Fulvimonas yonginensis TaxID=1495200 RepID=A0ABU8J9X4_9GAMM
MRLRQATLPASCSWIARARAGHAGDGVLRDVTGHVDGDRGVHRGVAGCGDEIAPHAVAGAVDQDAGGDVAVQPVVLDQDACAAAEIDPASKAANDAMADRRASPAVAVDALGSAAAPGGRAVEPEAVAVEGDVVRGNGDGVAAGGRSRQVVAQAPRPRRREGRRNRIDETGAVVVALGGPGGSQDEQAAEQ